MLNSYQIFAVIEHTYTNTKLLKIALLIINLNRISYTLIGVLKMLR